MTLWSRRQIFYRLQVNTYADHRQYADSMQTVCIVAGIGLRMLVLTSCHSQKFLY